MQRDIQSILDAVEQRMDSSSRSRYPGLSASNSMLKFVRAISETLFTLEEQQQVETILTKYQECLRDQFK